MMPAGPAMPEPLRTALRNTKADVVVLNFFSLTCSRCPPAATHANRMFDEARRQGMGDRIAFFAVGPGHGPAHCELYRTRYGVSFAVLADENRAVTACFGKLALPLMVMLRRTGDQWIEFHRTRSFHRDPRKTLAPARPWLGLHADARQDP